MLPHQIFLMFSRALDRTDIEQKTKFRQFNVLVPNQNLEVRDQTFFRTRTCPGPGPDFFSGPGLPTLTIGKGGEMIAKLQDENGIKGRMHKGLLT